jgi:pyruvate, orthophosphate dikinase
LEAKELIRQIGEREPLNPYQIAGMASVIHQAGSFFREGTVLEVQQLPTVLMVLDRTGAEAAPRLIEHAFQDSRLTLFPKFSRESLETLVYLTPFAGRREAVRENLIPVLYEIPNWLDLVTVLSRYSLERDAESLADHLDQVMEVMLAYFFAASTQPFDAQARAEGEYALCRLIESVARSADTQAMERYMPFLERALTFLTYTMFCTTVNSFERRVIETFGIKAALNKRSDRAKELLIPKVRRLTAQAIVTALGQIRPCPTALVQELWQAATDDGIPEGHRFRTEVLDRINQRSSDEVENLRRRLEKAVLCDRDLQEPCSKPLAPEGRPEEAGPVLDDSEISAGIAFIKDVALQWKAILAGFQEMIDLLTPAVQEAFSRILAVQILEVDKPEVKELLIEGLCQIVIRLEKNRKKASQELVHFFATLFLDRAYESSDIAEVVSSLKAIESLGCALGRQNYFLMAQELIDHLIRRPLIRPREIRYAVEDDDTGEPLVLAEDSTASRAHVQHIKSLMAIVASHPRVMHRLLPYLIVQIEIGGSRLCDEDLIQYSISSLLRANTSVTHFPVRTLIKALPYSFKDIGPLDTLRLTAAGLAKELANRGVKPVGNFLGKLRGDIHWLGSIENFYFCQGIMRYFATGRPEYLADWMPPESMPYLGVENWCSAEEADGIKDLCLRIFETMGISLGEKDSLMRLVSVDTSLYRNDATLPEFCRRMVLDVIELLKGLYTKYFIVREATEGSSADEDLDKLARIVADRLALKEQFLTPDIREPLPPFVTLTEGSDDYVREMDRIQREQPGTPIVLRAKKAGHAYAQKATYIEERFEAFNKDLRWEALQETLATSINNRHFEKITHENLPQALTFFDHLIQGISVNGHSCYYLEQAGRDLRRAGALGLTFDKVRDLLRIIKTELDDVHSFYRTRFEEPFDNFLSVCPMDKLPRKLKDLTTLKEIPETDFFKNYLKTLYISDLQARDGNLRVLETFLDKVELFLSQRLAESGRKVVNKGGSRRRPVPFYFPDQEEISPCRIGLKASLLRFAENTPAYFVITTDQPLKPGDHMLKDRAFHEGLEQAVQKLGTRWGRALGDPANPALFSVRSGARVSMPGMMITITNVGINDEIAESLARNVDPWFAYDCYRRFLQEFSQAAFGVGREEFQELIDESKSRLRVMRKAQLSASQMKELAFAYKKRVSELAPRAVEMLDQGRFIDLLVHCAMVVMHSVEGEAALKYREAAGIHGNWRTPVIVQGMVYGNMERNSSGTGVVSYDPFTMDLRGDFALSDQGTDVVNGKVSTIPVVDPWQSQETLASQMPAAWKQLSSILFRTAERLHFDTRLEYTIEKGQVYLLQIRKDRERKERVPPLAKSGYRVICRGTGISGKIFRGIMVTDRNQIAPFRHINKAQSIIDAMNEDLSEAEKLDGFIFVVNDPIPEEIMQEVFSLPVNTALISRLGGRGAHAADISKSLGKVYVGQVRQIVKFTGRPESVQFNDLSVVVGSKLIIHGQTGEVALYTKQQDGNPPA